MPPLSAVAKDLLALLDPACVDSITPVDRWADVQYSYYNEPSRGGGLILETFEWQIPHFHMTTARFGELDAQICVEIARHGLSKSSLKELKSIHAKSKS